MSEQAEIVGTEPLTSPQERYWPEFDGLRAVAVLLVIGYHAGLSPVRRGGVGVDVFFTLSGFLITTVLLEEYVRRRTFSLRRFYFRRVLRLYPALLFARGCPGSRGT
jgi:peptidoglycan/LPS O-acetylase OafA/YrhL